MLNKECELELEFSQSPVGNSFQTAKCSLHMQFTSTLSFLCPASSIPRVEISLATTLQTGSGFAAVHTRMLYIQPGQQTVAAQQTEELQGRYRVILLSPQLLTTIRSTEIRAIHSLSMRYAHPLPPQPLPSNVNIR